MRNHLLLQLSKKVVMKQLGLALVQHMNSREKAQEWQQWQNDVLDRIADHPTFEDLGMEHEVFDLECVLSTTYT